MSEVLIRRRSRQIPITLTTTTDTAQTLDLCDFSGGVVDVGTLSASVTTLQCWGASSNGGTFRRLYNADGSVADITLAPSTAAGGVFALPDAVFGVPFLEVVAGHAAGTGVPAIITLKS
jgi:hypothetical protein